MSDVDAYDVILMTTKFEPVEMRCPHCAGSTTVDNFWDYQTYDRGCCPRCGQGKMEVVQKQPPEVIESNLELFEPEK